MAKTPRRDDTEENTVDPFDTAPAPVQQTDSLTGGLTDPDQYKTTQETSGPDPVDPPVPFDPPPPPLGIGASEPYPTGNPPPDPHEPEPEA